MYQASNNFPSTGVVRPVVAFALRHAESIWNGRFSAQLPNHKVKRQVLKARKLAFVRQSGRCCYCNCPMWMSNAGEFAALHGISIKQARQLQCTAEHLHARRDGGSNRQDNIAAACWYCNQLRHARHNPPLPHEYQRLVSNRVIKGRWHRLGHLSLRQIDAQVRNAP